jgi:hypothetical protein
MRLSGSYEQYCSVPLDYTSYEITGPLEEFYSLFKIDNVHVAPRRMDVGDIRRSERGWDVSELSGSSGQLGKEVGFRVGSRFGLRRIGRRFNVSSCFACRYRRTW